MFWHYYRDLFGVNWDLVLILNMGSSWVKALNLQPFSYQPRSLRLHHIILDPNQFLNSTHKHVFHVDEPLVTSKLEILYLLNYSVIERFIFLQWGFHIVIESLFADWQLYWPSLLCLKLCFMDMLENNPVRLFAFSQKQKYFPNWEWCMILRSLFRTVKGFQLKLVG